jgi:hypothetical protein
MPRKLASITPFAMATVWAQSALAKCPPGLAQCGGPGKGNGPPWLSTPEIDAAGALPVIALLVSLVAIVYARARR